MAPGYGISSIGSYANDPYFMYALNSYNPNFMGTQQSVQAPAAAQSAPAAAVTTEPAGIDPTFKGSEKDDDDGISTGKLITGGLLVAGGALACLKAYKRGDGTGLKKMFNGFKQYGQKLLGTSAKEGAEKAAEKADDAAAKISNIIKNGGKNLQEYTIQKDGMSFVMKDGNPVKIITQDKKVITDIAKWKRDNSALWNKISSFTPTTGKLPKNIKFDSVARNISYGGKNYKVILNNEGKITNVYRIGKTGQLNYINNLDDFLTKNTAFAKQAETFEYSKKGLVHLKNSSGNYAGQTKDVQLTVRNGEFVSARYKDGSSWVDIEDEKTIEKLKETFKDTIPKIGKQRGYGLEAKDCLYRYTDDVNHQSVRFFGDKSPFEFIKEDAFNSTNKVNNFFSKHSELKKELDNIVSTGNISSGFRIGNMTYKSDSGVVYNISGDKINGIKLNKKITLGGKTFKAGEIIDGKYLGEWRKTAEYNNDFQAVLDLLK